MRTPSLLLLCLIVSLSACSSTKGRLGEDMTAVAVNSREDAFRALDELFMQEDRIQRVLSLAKLQAEFSDLTLQFPFDADIKAALGALALEQGDRYHSRIQLSEAVRLDPGHVAAATLLTRLLAEEGDVPGARNVVETALMFQRGDAELLLAYAQIEGLDGEAAKALELLDQALEAGAEPWRVELDRSYVLEFSGNPEAAREAMLRARKMSPDATRYSR